LVLLCDCSDNLSVRGWAFRHVAGESGGLGMSSFIVISSPADLLKHGIKHELCDLCKKEKKVDDLYAARGVLIRFSDFVSFVGHCECRECLV
jgi:hypothetical protein